MPDESIWDEPALTERGSANADLGNREPAAESAEGPMSAPRSASAADPKPVSTAKRARRSFGPAPIDEPRRGDCSAYAPRGTRCKICGGVHQ
jgi:hypothetical protein